MLYWLITFILFTGDTWYGEETLFIKPTSSVEIQGTSNLVDFNCRIEGNQFADTVDIAFQNSENEFTFKQFSFPLPVDKFSCGNRFLTSDFKKTLCEEDHPFMTVSLLKFTQTRVHDSGEMDWGILEAEFTIAGVHKTYYVEVRRVLNDMGFIMNGKVKVNMCEFGLEPKSSMPMVKVSDALNVDFSFAFDQL